MDPTSAGKRAGGLMAKGEKHSLLWFAAEFSGASRSENATQTKPHRLEFGIYCP